ncbi:hypothetical protein [Flavobacterium johnsoniae]|uniref:Hypothetical lipoprotein n=1 Tax=Flavobacterium johnsoniae (strain ATCC 17061 / DSM 2064 / JCM 8514 / BCRC 14874 / CCUG 350202 / NBRC 14942 / NCIMB 11054 / UW101) TaxID=376686 RepID=A5FFG7_FLAJ1|nr:hypothetical protein [Flavobacterium johnsoniae]ABQ06048.1 hypothetical lipoprotein [Flavobacterium johnsoniae UW101]OXG00590.1 hypothetical protein B0A63_08710 [Flavobacterium johnsoniae UW101]WQG81785.1 hypothetical protein SR927_01520 [Flavobacterium johnsoniae UW101]SHK64196.1 hypothetical protein SAMN05444146_1754 [Flavobacterium johnsoniae]
MKNFNLLLAILPFFTIACSPEPSSGNAEYAQAAKNLEENHSDAENLDNPYDAAGSFYSKILDIMDTDSLELNSVEHAAVMIDSIADTYPELDGTANDAVLHRRLHQLTAIIASESTMDDILPSSILGQEARTSLMQLEGLLTMHADDPYEALYAQIVSYEQDVLGNSSLSTGDKQILLITSSVVRYSTERKRKDKDWETSVTRIAQTVFASEDNVVLGLKMAAAVGICQKHSIGD